MAEHRWTLTDDATSSQESWAIAAADVPGTPADWRVTKRMLNTGLSQGVELVEIDNGRMRIAIVPTRGMGLWRMWIGDRMLGWRSPVRGPVHPALVPIAEPSGLGWLSGFDELMCRCGLASNGAPDFDEHGQLLYPLHGRIANLPAHTVELIVDDTAGSITLRGVVDETRFHFQKLRLQTSYTTDFHSQSITWHDRVENFGGGAQGMQMLYHANVGQPQLDPGSRLVAPIRQLVPATEASAGPAAQNWDTYAPPRSGFLEHRYDCQLLSDDAGRTRVMLANAAGDSAVALHFNTRQLPCFTLWKNLVAEADGYVTGLEPGTNFPDPRSVEARRGRVVSLDPEDGWQASVTLDWLSDQAAISEVERLILDLQGSHEPIIQHVVASTR